MHAPQTPARGHSKSVEADLIAYALVGQKVPRCTGTRAEAAHGAQIPDRRAPERACAATTLLREWMPILVVRSVAGVITGPTALLTGATLHHCPAGKGRDKRLLAQLNQGSLDIGIEEEWRQALGLRAPALADKAGMAERLAERALNALDRGLSPAGRVRIPVVKRVMKALRSTAVKA